MAWQDAKIALCAGDHDHLDHFREQQALGRNQFELDALGH
jgi:hypothetical protein